MILCRQKKKLFNLNELRTNKRFYGKPDKSVCIGARGETKGGKQTKCFFRLWMKIEFWVNFGYFWTVPDEKLGAYSSGEQELSNIYSDAFYPNKIFQQFF